VASKWVFSKEGIIDIQAGFQSLRTAACSWHIMPR